MDTDQVIDICRWTVCFISVVLLGINSYQYYLDCVSPPSAVVRVYHQTCFVILLAMIAAHAVPLSVGPIAYAIAYIAFDIATAAGYGTIIFTVAIIEKNAFTTGTYAGEKAADEIDIFYGRLCVFVMVLCVTQWVVAFVENSISYCIIYVIALLISLSICLVRGFRSYRELQSRLNNIMSNLGASSPSVSGSTTGSTAHILMSFQNYVLFQTCFFVVILGYLCYLIYYYSSKFNDGIPILSYSFQNICMYFY